MTGYLLPILEQLFELVEPEPVQDILFFFFFFNFFLLLYLLHLQCDTNIAYITHYIH